MTKIKKNPGCWFDLKPFDDSCMMFIYECYKLCDPPSGIEICCPTNPKILFFVRMPKRSGNCTTIFHWNGKYRKCKAKRKCILWSYFADIYNTVCCKIRGKSAIVRRFSICLPQRVKRFFDKKVKCSSCSSASEIQSKITISYYFTVFPPFIVHCVFVDLIRKKFACINITGLMHLSYNITLK